MTAYYNENDPQAAAWLRELIKNGLIAHGDVDERDIRDVPPADLGGYTQCHFFAGIGGWSYALRLARWPDDKIVWTGSCPCQPFSTAGRGKGVADERHLWPHFHWLIKQCRPPVVFGEQVASKDGLAWLDLVSTDLEGSGYAVGAADLCAAGVGSPHIRQRLYWVADAESSGRREEQQNRRRRDAGVSTGKTFGRSGDGSSGGVADAERQQRQECLSRPGQSDRPQESRTSVELARLCGFGRMGNATSEGLERHAGDGQGESGRSIQNRSASSTGLHSAGGGNEPLNGFWRDADWLFCQDGKWRAVEPGTFPLAHGVPARVGRLRGYGNAIVPQVAQTFIEAYLGAV